MAIPHPRRGVIIVQKPDEEPIPKPVLAEAIVKIGAAAESLRKSGLNRRGVLALLADKTGYGKGTLACVLDALEDLTKDYCR